MTPEAAVIFLIMIGVGVWSVIILMAIKHSRHDKKQPWGEYWREAVTYMEPERDKNWAASMLAETLMDRADDFDVNTYEVQLFEDKINLQVGPKLFHITVEQVR